MGAPSCASAPVQDSRSPAHPAVHAIGMARPVAIKAEGIEEFPVTDSLLQFHCDGNEVIALACVGAIRQWRNVRSDGDPAGFVRQLRDQHLTCHTSGTARPGDTELERSARWGDLVRGKELPLPRVA